MKLIEVSLINETLLPSMLDPIKSLLSVKLRSMDLKIFDLTDISIIEAENKKGNYTLITRSIFEYPENLIKEELDTYSKELEETIKDVLSTLLSSENELYASRASSIILI